MKWFRYWSEALHDPKIQRLPAETFRGWINLLCIINETLPDRGPRSGFLPARIEDVAYRLHKTPEETRALVLELKEAGLLDEVRGRYRAHNWQRRQPASDNVTHRVRETRRRQNGNVSETFHETGLKQKRNRNVTPSETETEHRDRNRTEIEAESETEEEEDALARVRRHLRSLGIRGNSLAVEAALSESGLNCVMHCIDEAERHNKLSWAYVDTVRRRHEAEGCPPPELQTRTERITGVTRY